MNLESFLTRPITRRQLILAGSIAGGAATVASTAVGIDQLHQADSDQKRYDTTKNKKYLIDSWNDQGAGELALIPGIATIAFGIIYGLSHLRNQRRERTTNSAPPK